MHRLNVHVTRRTVREGPEPPHSAEAEMALLGAMILDPASVAAVAPVLAGPGDFYSDAHAAVYAALVRVYASTPNADLVVLLDHLRDRGELDLIGGPEYLQKLASETPGSTGAAHYARIVADKAKLRRLAVAGEQIAHDALHAGGGHPRHPLYVKGTQPLEPLAAACRAVGGQDRRRPLECT